MKSTLTNCFVLLLCIAVSVTGGSTYSWTLEYPDEESAFAPAPRYHHGFALVNEDTAVFVGGYDFDQGGIFLSDTWLYQISTHKWKFALNTTALGRAYFTLNSFRGEVIAYGGNSRDGAQNGFVYGDIWRYRLNANSWVRDNYINLTQSVSILLPRQYHASAVVHHILYVFGGHTQIYGYTTSDLLAYNLENNTWAVVQRSGSEVGPSGRQGHTLLPYDDPIKGWSLILFGGYADRPWNGGFEDTWQYVINTSEWLQLSNTTRGPSARYGHSGAVVNGSMIIYGGMSTHNITTPPVYDEYYSDVWVLKLYGGGNSEWMNVARASEPGYRAGHQTAVLNSTVYHSAGYIQFQGLGNDIWSLTEQK
jgi:hypothetical protein